MSEVESKRNFQLAFASDVAAGAHPLVLQRLIQDNEGYAAGYGDDHVSFEAKLVLSKLFQVQKENIYWVPTGTAANVLSLAVMLPTAHSVVICNEFSHLNTDEAGAPEKLLGVKIRSVPTADGKLRVGEELKALLHDVGVKRRAQPKLLSFSQTTELGTVYTLEEQNQLCDWAHENGLLVHMDGSRLFNAAAALGVAVGELVRKVDVVSLGLTKIGCMESTNFASNET